MNRHRLGGDEERVVNIARSGSHSSGTPENKAEDEPDRMKERDALTKILTFTGCIMTIIALLSLLGFNVYQRREFQAAQTDLKAKALKWFEMHNEFNMNRQNEFKESKEDSTDNREEEKSSLNAWFLAGKTLYSSIPAPRAANRLWPSQQQQGDDRIVNQLLFQLPVDSEDTPSHLKTILIYTGAKRYSLFFSSFRTLFNKCPVNTCQVTLNRSESQSVDVILYRDGFIPPGHQKVNGQVWVMHYYECPYHTPRIWYKNAINMTVSYRSDSDLVDPYGKYVYYNSSVRQLSEPLKNFAANKSKQVAWFVSNCKATNGRLEYAHELQKYISVDIYGKCGSKTCSITKEVECFKLLQNEYKFYLAFENSNCKDYITEKLFVNGLMHDVLPIVMGARPEDYKLVAPEHSYIHVDEFDSPQALARYLLLLDKNDDMYNSYFKWKGTGEFINTHFWCRFCALLHTKMPSKPYMDINQWWSGPGTCSPGYSKHSRWH